MRVDRILKVEVLVLEERRAQRKSERNGIDRLVGHCDPDVETIADKASACTARDIRQCRITFRKATRRAPVGSLFNELLKIKVIVW